MAKANVAKAAAAPAPVDVEEEVGGEEGEAETSRAPSGPAAMFEGSGEEGFVIDLSSDDENAGGFPVMPRGNYQCVIDDCTYGLSQRSGNPMWTITFEVAEGEFAGQKLFFHLPFTPKMRSRIKRFLVRVAPELASTPINPKDVAEQGTLSGKAATVRVDIKKYEGEDRNNVRDVLPPSAEGAGGGSFL